MYISQISHYLHKNLSDNTGDQISLDKVSAAFANMHCKPQTSTAKASGASQKSLSKYQANPPSSNLVRQNTCEKCDQKYFVYR